MGRKSNLKRAMEELEIKKIDYRHLTLKTVNVRTHEYRNNLFKEACKIKGVSQRQEVEGFMDKTINEVFGNGVLMRMYKDISESHQSVKEEAQILRDRVK